jgi:hypothetical protein
MRLRARAALATAVLLTAALTGCGGDDGDGGGGGGEGGSDSGSDFTEQTADEMSDAAKAAMSDLTGVTVDGSLSSDGEDIDITISVGEGGNCTGSFGTQGASAEILGVDGTTWFRPDAAFWELFAGPEVAPQIIAAAGDRWVTLPADDTSFSPFCDIEEFLSQLVDGAGGEATYSKGESKDIDGEETIEIISDRGDEGASSGYVLVEGDHYVVSIVKDEGEDPGEISFSGFDEQPDVEAPAEDEQIALEDLESGAY